MIVLSLPCLGQSEVLHKYLDIQRQRINFNGVVLVAKHNQVLYQVHVGKASQELDVPINPAAVFRIASISKQFTATLVALAVEEGKLTLDDSLGTFFPELKDTRWQKINVHQLLSHTSGITHNEGIADYWTLKSRLPLSNEQALAELFATNLIAEPGTEMNYSSPGYLLLACILEAIYQQPYAAILSERILLPLQLHHSGVCATNKLIPGMVSTYHVQGDSLMVAPYRDFSLMRGSGDLYANAEDLAKWNSSFSTDGVWSERLKTLLFTSYTDKIPGYGYGWFIRTEGRLAYYHGGGTFGCSALSAWYPDEQLSIVILSNVSVLPVNELWGDIEKIVFNEPFELPSMTGSIHMGTAELQTFTGLYVQGQQELTIMLVNDQLYAKLGANPAFEIYPENKLNFFGKKVTIRLTFKSEENNRITGLEAHARGQIHHFIKK